VVYKQYTDEQVDYLREIAYKRTRGAITDMFNAKFGTDKSVRSIGCQLSRKKIRTGMQGHATQIKKGNVPWNKGIAFKSPGSEKGWFKDGNVDNQLPIGSEAEKNGFITIKTAQPLEWKYKHRVMWEEAYGEIPDDHYILFKDDNKKNVTLDNLFMVKDVAMRSVARRRMRSEHPDINVVTHKLTELDLTLKKMEESQ